MSKTRQKFCRRELSGNQNRPNAFRR